MLNLPGSLDCSSAQPFQIPTPATIEGTFAALSERIATECKKRKREGNDLTAKSIIHSENPKTEAVAADFFPKKIKTEEVSGVAEKEPSEEIVRIIYIDEEKETFVQLTAEQKLMLIKQSGYFSALFSNHREAIEKEVFLREVPKEDRELIRTLILKARSGQEIEELKVSHLKSFGCWSFGPKFNLESDLDDLFMEAQRIYGVALFLEMPVFMQQAKTVCLYCLTQAWFAENPDIKNLRKQFNICAEMHPLPHSKKEFNVFFRCALSNKVKLWHLLKADRDDLSKYTRFMLDFLVKHSKDNPIDEWNLTIERDSTLHIWDDHLIYFVKIVKLCPNIEAFSIKELADSGAWERYPDCMLNNFFAFSDEVTNEMMSSFFSKLKRLSLISPILNDETISLVARSCPALEEIDFTLAEGRLLDYKELSSIKSLKLITIFKYNEFTDGGERMVSARYKRDESSSEFSHLRLS